MSLFPKLLAILASHLLKLMGVKLHGPGDDQGGLGQFETAPHNVGAENLVLLVLSEDS